MADLEELYGWGRYPRLGAQRLAPRSRSEALTACALSDEEPAGALIARGLGRSYGDSALGARVLDTCQLGRLIDFDEGTGDLTCEAGVSLDEILRVFVPRGWFLPVTPGTRFVTVGGAIASDVHGKNHHLEGTFSQHVSRIELLLGNGERFWVSPDQHPELFRATAGGMGLTGVILAATFRLKRVRSRNIAETTFKAQNLEAVLEAFDAHAAATYSVAWIDCLSRGRHLGRSLLTVGEHADDGVLAPRPDRALAVPIDMPAFLLNRFSVRAFNELYYARIRHSGHARRVPYEPFFYPLDAIRQWNRLYGKPGFVQYQFVLPRAAGPAGLRGVLERIAASGLGSFLAVLKVFGRENANPLSFPVEGYTLALDFKVEARVFKLLDELDRQVLDLGGRLYLAKDARMSEATFKAAYPRWQEFEAVRARYHAIGRFASAQSQRLGLQ